jgi:hypothetical protein
MVNNLRTENRSEYSITGGRHTPFSRKYFADRNEIGLQWKLPPNKLAQAAAFLSCNQKVVSSNLDRDADYLERDFPPSHHNSQIYALL